MKKEILLLATVLIIAAQAFSQTTYTVSAAGTNSGTSWTTVKAAIAAAASGDIIQLAAETFTEKNITFPYSNPNYIPKSITIKGAGMSLTTLRAYATPNNTPTAGSSVFNLDGLYSSAITITIQDMTIENGYNDSNGGGIRITNTGTVAPTLNFTNLKIANNVGLTGGGIFIAGYATTLITGCNITANTASSNTTGNGGGVFFDPGLNKLLSATIRNSTISLNTAGYLGGGIMVLCLGDNTNLVSNQLDHRFVVENTTIYKNSCTTATKLGGGIDFRPAGSTSTFCTHTATLNHCTIVGNTTNAGTGGDGVCFEITSPVTLVMYNSVIMGNSGSSSNISQLGTNGGSQATILNGGVTNNIVGINSGGSGKTITTANNNNLSAVIADMAYPTLDNSALSADATPVLVHGTASIARDYVTSNALGITTDQLGSLRDDKPDAGAYESRARVVISAGTGGAVSGGGISYTKGDNVALVATPNPGYRFVSWTLNTSGGAVQSTAASYSFTLAYSVTLVANFAPTTLYVPSAHATIQAALTAAVTGDIIDIAAGTYTEKNLTISNKSVTIKGAGIGQTVVQGFATAFNTQVNNCGVFDFSGTYTAGVTLTLQDMTIQNGYNALSGGAVRISNAGTQADAPTLNLTNLKMINNSAVNGGGVYISGPVNLVVSGADISGNRMTSTSGIGGGIAFLPTGVYVVNGIIRNSTISNNISAGPGGGIAVLCGANGSTAVAHSLWVENSTIYGNSCTTSGDIGGGIFFRMPGSGQAVTPTQAVTLNHCTIVNNTTNNGVGGDGVCLENGAYQLTLSMKNSIVMGNSGAITYPSQIGTNAASQTMITNAGISNCILGIISGGNWVTAGATNNIVPTPTTTGSLLMATVLSNLAFANDLSTDATPVLKIGQASIAKNYVASDLLSPVLTTDQLGRTRSGNADAGAYEVQAAQTITFGSLANKLLSDANFALTGSASSTLTVTYASSNTAVATVSGSTVTIVGPGTVNITASQAGNSAYEAAADVVQSFTVSNTYNFPSTAGISTLTKLTAASDLVVSGILTIDANKTVHSVTVQPDAKLNLSTTNTLTVTDLILEAGKSTAPSVSVTHAMTVTGSVKVHKTLDRLVWYFISFPANVNVNSIEKFSGTGVLTALGDPAANWWIKYYDGSTRATNGGATTNWKNMVAGDVLEANRGYIVGLANSFTDDCVLSFPFVNANILSIPEPAKTVTVGLYGEGTAATSNVGWNLVGVPYLSKLDGSGVGAEFITVFNGATYDQYANTGVATLNPFSAFFIQASLLGTTANLAFNLGNRQLVKSAVSNDLTDRVQLNLTTPTGSDHTNLIIDDSKSTGYVINQDLNKWMTTGTDKPQLYTVLGGVEYAYNALPISAVNELPLAYYSRTTADAVISVDASQAPTLSQLLLKDKTNGCVTDLLTSDYKFKAAAGTNNTRFSISAQSVTTTSKTVLLDATKEPQITVVSGQLEVKNIPDKSVISVYDMCGHLVDYKECADSVQRIPLPVKGIYTIAIQTQKRKWVKKVVI